MAFKQFRAATDMTEHAVCFTEAARASTNDSLVSADHQGRGSGSDLHFDLLKGVANDRQGVVASAEALRRGEERRQQHTEFYPVHPCQRRRGSCWRVRTRGRRSEAPDLQFPSFPRKTDLYVLHEAGLDLDDRCVGNGAASLTLVFILLVVVAFGSLGRGLFCLRCPWAVVSPDGPGPGIPVTSIAGPLRCFTVVAVLGSFLRGLRRAKGVFVITKTLPTKSVRQDTG